MKVCMSGDFYEAIETTNRVLRIEFTYWTDSSQCAGSVVDKKRNLIYADTQ